MARRTRRPDDDEDEPIARDDVRDDDDDEDGDDEGEGESRQPEPPRYIQRRLSVSERDEDVSDQTIPDRVLRITLAPPWSHLRIYGWFDYPKDIADRMISVEGETSDEALARVMDVLREVIVRHDGWKDGRGNVLPQPYSRKFWEAIPNALASEVIRKFFSMVKRNPTPPGSARRTKRR